MVDSFPDSNHPDNKQQITNFFFAPITAQLPTSRQKTLLTVCYSQEHSLTTITSNVAICFKQTCRLRVNYDVNAASMRTGIFVLYIRVGINLVNATMLTLQWTKRIKREKMQRFSTDAQKPLSLEGKILLHAQLGALCFRIWFSIFHDRAEKYTVWHIID